MKECYQSLKINVKIKYMYCTYLITELYNRVHNKRNFD